MSAREAVTYLPEKGLYCQRLPGRRARGAPQPRKGKRADTMGFYGTLKMIFYKVSAPRHPSYVGREGGREGRRTRGPRVCSALPLRGRKRAGGGWVCSVCCRGDLPAPGGGC